MNLVFVYGTLKMNGSNHIYIRDAEFKGTGRTVDKFQFFSNRYFPMITPPDEDNPGIRIEGEVYSVTDDQLRSLDCLEANGRMYERREVKIRLNKHGKRLACWIYVYIRPTDGLQRIERFNV